MLLRFGSAVLLQLPKTRLQIAQSKLIRVICKMSRQAHLDLAQLQNLIFLTVERRFIQIKLSLPYNYEEYSTWLFL